MTPAQLALAHERLAARIAEEWRREREREREAHGRLLRDLRGVLLDLVSVRRLLAEKGT